MPPTRTQRLNMRLHPKSRKTGHQSKSASRVNLTKETVSLAKPPKRPLSGSTANRNRPKACLLGKENSYEVSVTISVGANLDFGAIVAAGVSAEVSTSTAKWTTDSNQQECTGPWSCSMILTPKVQEVAGKQFVWVGCPSEKKEFPYTAQFPIKSGDNLPIQHGELCQCRNYDGFDEGAEDAPVPCPNDC